MVESRYVLYGLIAGLIAGIVTAVITAVSLFMQGLDKAVEYALKEAAKFTPLIDISMLREYIRIGLLISPFVTIIIMVVLGAIFGALYEYLDKKMGYPPIVVPILTTGLFLSMLLVLPNIILGGMGKAIMNFITCIVYTVSLLILSYRKCPRVTTKTS